MRTRSLRTVVFLAAGVGLLVAIFAALEFYESSLRSYCTYSSFLSCAAVDKSAYTTTFGIPDYLWGVGGFLLILIVAGISESRKTERLWYYLLLFFTNFGVGFSIYFLYVQLALIGALCVICTTADVFGWIAWAGAIALAYRRLGARPPLPAPDHRTREAGSSARTKGPAPNDRRIRRAESTPSERSPEDSFRKRARQLYTRPFSTARDFP